MMRTTTLQISQTVLWLLFLAAMVQADLRGASSSGSGAIGEQRSVDELLQVERFLATKPGLSTNDVLEGPGGDKPAPKSSSASM